MVAQYPPDIYLWLRDRGGVEKMSRRHRTVGHGLPQVQGVRVLAGE